MSSGAVYLDQHQDRWCPMLLLSKNLPVRIFDDLRVEADPGAVLTPAQGLALAEQLTHQAIRKRVQAAAKAAPLPVKVTA